MNSEIKLSTTVVTQKSKKSNNFRYYLEMFRATRDIDGVDQTRLKHIISEYITIIILKRFFQTLGFWGFGVLKKKWHYLKMLGN
jgi:hypothetical protein